MAIQYSDWADVYSFVPSNLLYNWARNTGNLGNIANYYVDSAVQASGRLLYLVRDIADKAAVPLSGYAVPALYIGPWASRPAAASAAVGTEIIITDLPDRPRFYSDGTYWRPVGGRCLLFQGASSALASPYGETVFLTIPVPANALCLTGQVRVAWVMQITNNANNKNYWWRFGGTGLNGTMMMGPVSIVSIGNLANNFVLQNLSATSQFGGYGAINGSLVLSALDTTQTQNLYLTANASVAGDTVQAWATAELFA